MTATRLLLLGSMSLALLAPAGSRAATDDAPDRTHSGKVSASRDASLPPAYGPNPAKVVVVVFSDFECPVCRRITDATHQIAEEFPGEVRVEFLQLPLSSHPHALDAAVAALAAHRQNKFWEMHDVLFANQGALDAGSLTQHAEKVGLDMTRWRKDIADPQLRARAETEARLAAALGARATPAFLVNGALSVGWGSWMAFRRQVEQELQAANPLLAKGTKLADVHAQRAQENLKDEAARKAYMAEVADPLAKAAAKKK
jgi:protein-disulfide isomerase